MSHSDFGWEFKVNESTIYANKVFYGRNRHNARLCIDQLMKM